jgi:hypothetical protein
MKKNMAVIISTIVSMSMSVTGLYAGSCCGTKQVVCPTPANTQEPAPVNKPAGKTVKKQSVKKQYVCPMGCETKDKPGTCSKCGMKLELKKNEVKKVR